MLDVMSPAIGKPFAVCQCSSVSVCQAAKADGRQYLHKCN